MNSSEIAQMFAAQNQMFMGQNQYAQQIGVSAPAMGGGYAAGGNRFASGAMSAMGGAASIASSMALDPMGGFIGGALGGLARGGIGAAFGGGLMAAAPMIPLAAAAQIGIGSMVRGGTQQAAIQQNLGGYQFMNAGARGGQGFSRDDAKAIGDQVRALSHIPEMMTSVDELTRLMPRLKQAGVMQGVRSAAEFSQRFKEAVSTIRDISKVMGSTMEEAEHFFTQSRSMGFMGRNGALRNTLNAQFTAAQTGMDMGQVMQMQMTGAGMSRSVGGRGAQGATAISNIAQRIEAGRQNGNISEEMIQDVSGQGGALGVQGAAERMYGLMLNMRNTAAGRLVMAGAMKRDANGKVALDEDVIRKFNSGAMGIEDLKRRASSLSDNDKISFAYRAQGSLGSQLAGSLDAGHMMQGLVGGKGQDAAALVLSRYTGGNEQDVDMMMGMGQMGSDGDVRSMAKLRAREAAFRERTDPSMIMKRLGTRIKASTTGPIEQAGAKIYSELAKSWDSVVDDFLGRAVVQVTQQGADGLAKAMSGGSKDDLKKIIAAAAGLREASAGGGGGLVGGLRNSDAAAFLMRGGTDTGRSMQAQFDFTKSITGGGGMTDAARMAQGRMLNRGQGKDVGGAGGIVNRLRAEIDNFRDMDDERKLVELRGSIQNRIAEGALMGAGIADSKELVHILSTEGPGAADEHLRSLGIKGGLKEAIQKMEVSSDPAAKDAARLLRTGLSAQQAGAADVLTGIISATQGKYEGGRNQVNIAGALRMGGDVDIKKMIAQSKKDMSEARDDLTRGWAVGIHLSGIRDESGAGLSDAEASVITNNPDARKALGAALSADDKKSAAVRKALNMEDKDDAVKALARLGFNVKASDIDSMNKVLDKGDTGAGDVIKKAIAAYEKGEAGGNYVAIASAAKNKAADIESALANTEGLSPEAMAAAKAVQDRLGALGDTVSEGNVDELKKSIGALSDQIASGGAGAESLVSATGDFGSMIQSTLEQAKSLKGKKKISQSDVISAFGLNEKDPAIKRMLDQMGVVGGTGSSNVDVNAITKNIEGMRTAGMIVKKGQGEAGAAETGEQKLLKSLDKIDKTLDKNMAVMTLVAAGKKADISDAQVSNAQRMLKEDNPPPENSSHS